MAGRSAAAVPGHVTVSRGCEREQLSLLLTDTPNVYRTTSLARVTIGTSESRLELPDGTVWYFPGQWGYATRREDPFGNRLDVVYRPDFLWAVDHLVQHVGSFTRTVSFDYDDDGNVRALTYGTRTWQYIWATFTHGTAAGVVRRRLPAHHPERPCATCAGRSRPNATVP